MMATQTTLAIIAIVVAIGIIGVIVVETFVIPLQQQQAEARGCRFPVVGLGIQAFNASQGRCFHP